MIQFQAPNAWLLQDFLIAISCRCNSRNHDNSIQSIFRQHFVYIFMQNYTYTFLFQCMLLCVFVIGTSNMVNTGIRKFTYKTIFHIDGVNISFLKHIIIFMARCFKLYPSAKMSSTNLAGGS